FFLTDIRNSNSEVRRVARDVPVGERLFALPLEPFLRLVRHLWLKSAGLVDPLAQKLFALRVGEFEEVMLRGLQHRLRARERRVWVLELCGRIHRAAVLAGVAVLVLRA